MKTIIDKNIKIKTFLEMEKKNEVQIIDIREKYEHDLGSIPNAHHIPMDLILKSISSLEKSKNVVIFCRSGRRSAAVKYMLEKEFKLRNIYCLEGGYESFLNYQEKEKI